MGLHEPNNRTYLKVGYGKIRKKAKPDDPNATERKTQDGESTWAIEYPAITGKLENIAFRDDPNYGKSWSLLIADNEKFSLQVSEDSAYGRSLLRVIPNLHAGQVYTFTPYDFVPQGETEAKKGISVKDLAGEKVHSYYQEYTPKEGGGFTVKNINGFPEYVDSEGSPGNWKDKDEMKIYFTRATKFLRQSALDYIQSSSFTSAPQEEPGEKSDDLQF